jgi:hypothetical protein
MRYDCEDEAFSGDFVEFSDSFSRGQQRAIWAAAGEDEALFLELLRGKVKALHLTCIDAPPITDPAELTPERTDSMDLRLFSWLSFAWVAHMRGLTNLGNALGRKLLGISVIADIATKEAAPVNLNHS